MELNKLPSGLFELFLLDLFQEISVHSLYLQDLPKQKQKIEGKESLESRNFPCREE